ncbi:sulfotransferase family protein [Bradyrhizobium sp. SRS-191]|uniref:sulfotransferase family protein n=1 Tax=Bradyrhizobium sp. SRS-191 TaxID=2962606 RepID=UPI00211DF1C2|nr:sulfotransferase [Bradyrhizobium sp. SRS-191]
MMQSSSQAYACIVLGMHRSGTSALAHLLSCLGATLPLRLSPPGPDNPEGYFEPAMLVALHERLLTAAGSVWFDVKPFSLAAVPRDVAAGLIGEMVQAMAEDFPEAALPVIKDPRMCRFFPLFRQVLGLAGRESCVVLALRHPAEVAASLATRNRMSASYAGLLWARHVIAAEQDSRDVPRITLRYEDMLADWRGTAARIRTLPGPWHAEDPEDAPVKPSLRHHQALQSTDVFGPGFGGLLDRLHESLSSLADADDDGGRADVDAAAAEVLSCAARMSLSTEIEFLNRRLTTAHPAWASDDPERDEQAMAELFEQLNRSLYQGSRR